MGVKTVVREIEFLSDPDRGVYTRTIYYSDGTKAHIKIPKGPVIIPPVFWGI